VAAQSCNGTPIALNKADLRGWCPASEIEGDRERWADGHHVRRGRIAMNVLDDSVSQVIYWHRELPPADAQPMGEHVVEASSPRLPDTIARRDELWNRCEDELMSTVRLRLHQEVERLGGRYAHVLDESIETRHNPGTGEMWLQGRYTYMLYR
jgi:hypothetical protein